MKKLFYRFIFILCLPIGIFLSIACTPLGSVFYGALIAVLEPYLSKNASTTLCNAGNWAVNKFQPLVSDDEMIQHLVAHREKMDEIANSIAKKAYKHTHDGIDVILKNDLKMTKLRHASIRGSWALNPYSIDAAQKEYACDAKIKNNPETKNKPRKECRERINTVMLEPAFGRSSIASYCGNRSGIAFKSYDYFPPQPYVLAPKIFGNKLQLSVDMNENPVTDTITMVSNANKNDPEHCQRRKIDSNWFILVC